MIANSNVPDRVGHLHQGVFQAFRSAGVSAILHAGDISISRMLDDLRQVALVYDVRGNRDQVRLRHLPLRLDLIFGGIRVGLIHGQGNVWHYLWNKLDYYRKGYQFVLYRDVLLGEFPQSDVIIFGHSHIPVQSRV